MSKNKPKSLSELISSTDTALGRLATRAREKVGLTDHIRNGLEADLATGMVHCNIEDDGTLSVRASSPAWANRLRFEGEQILRLARERHPEATQVKVRVVHPQH